MSERILTQRELNRALLARQLLLRRERIAVARAIERVGALQAQYPPSPHVALFARLDAFTGAKLMRAVERRDVVKATLMRQTLHLVSARDYLAYGGLIRDARHAAMEKRAERSNVVADVARLSKELVQHTSDEPRSRPELLELLGLPKLRVEDPQPWVVWYLLVGECELVHSPESTVWRRNTGGGKFAPAPAWLGRGGARGPDAAKHLVGRYLAAFGPATRADLLQWTRLTLRALLPGLERLKLRTFRDEGGRELLDLPRAPLPDGDVEAPVRFLPMWDSVLLAHDDRTRILPDEYRKTVIRRNGEVQQTFLVDGVVAGTWTYDGGRVTVDAFAPLPPRVRREVDDEARRVAAFHDAQSKSQKPPPTAATPATSQTT